MKISPQFAALVLLSSQLWITAACAQDDTARPTSGSAAAQATLDLADLVREALNRNPEAQAALHTENALAHRVPQSKSLPDPMVSVGWAGNPAPFSVMSGDGSSYRGVTVSEQFPYPGKLKLQGEMAEKDVEAARADYELVRRRVAAEVAAAYYQYWYYGKAIETTNKEKELLEKLSEISEAQYRVGKGMQQDVLRSQLEISLLAEKLTVLEQQREAAQAEINALLFRAPETPLPPAADVTSSTLRYSLNELYALGAKNDSAAERDRYMVERSQLGVALAEKQSRPDFGVAYMYQQRDAQPDMYGLTVSVNVPIFYKSKQREAIAEAAENRLSVEKKRDSRLTEVQLELKQQYLAATVSERLLSLYSRGIVPQASLALESSMASYEVGKVDFLSLIANFTTLLNYETDYYRQLADHETAIARMESLTGVGITSGPGGANSIDHPAPEAEGPSTEARPRP